MVNSKLGNEMWKVNLSTWREHGTKKISNPWPPKQRTGALSTELRELLEINVI